MTTGDAPPPADLGDRVEVFRPMLSNTIAGFIISVLLAAAGVGVGLLVLRDARLNNWNLPVVADDKGASWLTLGVGALMGLVLVGCGVALAVYCAGLLSYRVEVYVGGLRARSRGSSVEVRWADVAAIHELVYYARPPVLKGAANMIVPKGMYTTYTVVTRAGAQHSYNANAIKSIRRFGRVLREVTGPRGVPWQTTTQDS